ncbi:MAG: potassium/proton antiporter, partial [Planctomycetota bacterium]
METTTTALLLLIGGLLAIGAVLFGRAAGRFGVPLLLIFLAVGMVAGSDGLLGIPFDDYDLAYRLGTAALVMILFDGGLQTPLESLRRVLVPAGLLASVGVLVTACMVAVIAWLLGFAWGPAMLLGAMVSSTDAAAVFSVLRGSGLQLRRRAGTTLEVESGINDPMAVILTMVLAGALVGDGVSWGLTWSILWQTSIQLIVGVIGGFGIGWLGRWILARVHLGAGLGPVFTLALACIAYGLPSLAWGSGFLAVYLAGMMLGNAHLPYRSGLLRVHDAIAWLSQVVMFIMLGLLVFPHQLFDMLLPGVIIAVALAVLIRPLAVALILVPCGYKRNEILFTGWVGLRG